MYDKAWRIALSYRYTRGSLLVVDNIAMPENSSPWFWKRFFEATPWGKHHGGCTFVKDRMDEDLFSAIAEFHQHGRILDRPDLDVKDILKNGKMIIEKKALDKILRDHSRDLPTPPPKATYPEGMYFS
ncbi:hypothetical protein F66182_16778 [Fusarium sp. NRRL 66182]|nr:hypothetical protein F66182_16778 [Fusarium sp. NRRL 66182]